MPVDKNLPILLVDDYPIMRKVARNMLRKVGFTNFLEANDGKEALDQLKNAQKNSEKISLILLDWSMPIISGIEVLKIIRANADWKDIPIVFLTARTDELARNAGKFMAEEYIEKPIDMK